MLVVGQKRNAEACLFLDADGVEWLANLIPSYDRAGDPFRELHELLQQESE